MGRLRNELLALVVPPLCAVCREPELAGAPLCAGCRRRLPILRDPRCMRCGAPRDTRTRACRECRGRGLAFTRAWSPFTYDGVARGAVGALKSGGKVALAATIASEIAARAPAGMLVGTLIPVPAHRRRRRRHGFNQAEAIARALGRLASLPVGEVLERDAGAQAQLGRERSERLVGARGSVRLRRGAGVPRRPVLVDDVYTTGATLDACARALVEGGAGEIVALTFARAVRA